MRPRRSLWILLLAAALIGGCTSSDGTKPSTAASPPATGGTVRLALTSHGGGVYPDLGYDPVHQDPAAGDEIYRCCLFRTLMSYNGRTTEEGGTIPLPDLASGVPTVSADRRTWVFKIRTGIHYAPPLQDVEVTAADFVRALERAWSPAPDSIKKVTGLAGEPRHSRGGSGLFRGG
jgi:ABC-type transport system substrate-binding protein